eukprot:5873270-Amphidinium_carterae.1
MSSATVSPDGGLARGGGLGAKPPGDSALEALNIMPEVPCPACSRVKPSTAPQDGERLSRIESPPEDNSLPNGLPRPCVLVSRALCTGVAVANGEQSSKFLRDLASSSKFLRDLASCASACALHS